MKKLYSIMAVPLAVLIATGAYHPPSHHHPKPMPSPTSIQTSPPPPPPPSGVWQSSAQYGTYSAVGTDGVWYHWNNDAWCSGHGPQTIWAANQDDWGVTSQQTFSTDCWVQTYPHIGWWGGKSLSSYPPIISTETETGPAGAGLRWEAAYDIWLNSSAGSDSGYEIMIWTDTHGVSPGGSVISTPTIDGVQYKFYQGAGGNGPASWFVRVGNTTSAVTNLSEFIAYVASLGGNYGGGSNPVVDTIEFGWEVWGTGGVPVNFKVSQYSVQA
jgi:xyloglucan-specific endo-beta-1,4-glucanase